MCPSCPQLGTYERAHPTISTTLMGQIDLSQREISDLIGHCGNPRDGALSGGKKVGQPTREKAGHLLRPLGAIPPAAISWRSLACARRLEMGWTGCFPQLS
jgi:hypothetical protein